MTLAVLSYQAGLLDPQILTGPRERVEQELVRHFVEASNTVYGQLQERRYRTDDVQRWLTGLADHLNHAAATTRTQTATEIHLAGLWRVAGSRRSRLLHAAANVVVIGAAWAASVQVALGFDRMGVFFRHVGERPPPNAAESAGLLAILVVWTALGLRQGLTRECAPRRASITQIAVPRNALRGLSLGVIGGVLTGVTGGAWLGPGLGFAVGAGTLAGIALVAGAFGGITDDVDPLGPLRTDLLFGLASGLIIGAGLTGAGVVSLAFGIDLDSLADTRGLSGVLIGTMLSGLMVGLTLVSAASIRYAVAVVILALNRRMPWRPGRFFVWAQRTGILRFAGVAMQFRHLELQRLLAAAKSTRA